MTSEGASLPYPHPSLSRNAEAQPWRVNWIWLSGLLALLDAHTPVKISKRRQHHPLPASELPFTQIKVLLRPQEVFRLLRSSSPNAGNVAVDSVEERDKRDQVCEQEMNWGVPEEDKCGDQRR